MVVDEVVEDGRVLAGVRAHEPTEALDGAPLGPGRRGEDQALEAGDVEPLVGERGGADHGEFAFTEGVEDGAALGLRCAAGERRRGDVVFAELRGEVLAVIDASGEHQRRLAAEGALGGEVE